LTYATFRRKVTSNPPHRLFPWMAQQRGGEHLASVNQKERVMNEMESKYGPGSSEAKTQALLEMLRTELYRVRPYRAEPKQALHGFSATREPTGEWI